MNAKRQYVRFLLHEGGMKTVMDAMDPVHAAVHKRMFSADARPPEAPNYLELFFDAVAEESPDAAATLRDIEHRLHQVDGMMARISFRHPEKTDDGITVERVTIPAYIHSSGMSVGAEGLEIIGGDVIPMLRIEPVEETNIADFEPKFGWLYEPWTRIDDLQPV